MKVEITDKRGKHNVHAVGCAHLNLGCGQTTVREATSIEEAIIADMGGCDDRENYKIFPCLK